VKPARQPRIAAGTDPAARRERLARARAATAAAQRPPDDRIRALMDARARALARPPAPAEPADTLAVVTFALADERYALETRYVREIVRLRDFTPVPGAPPFVRGVANLRGEVLCLVDLRRLVDLPSTDLNGRSRMVVLGTGRADFGVLVDETFEIARLRPDDILPPSGAVAGAGREYVAGVTREALIVLDGAALLRDPRLYVNQDDRTD
jgi:purine-binding chemotaxis protein CheW